MARMQESHGGIYAFFFLFLFFLAVCSKEILLPVSFTVQFDCNKEILLPVSFTVQFDCNIEILLPVPFTVQFVCNTEILLSKSVYISVLYSSFAALQLVLISLFLHCVGVICETQTTLNKSNF